MRLVACAFSAVLLSGCSWMGFGGGSSSGQQGYSDQQNARYSGNGAQYNAQTGRKALRGPMGRCQITSPTQRAPQGCRAEDVTLALGGAQGDYAAQNQYTSGGYGSHAQGTQAKAAPQQQRLRKPKLRGQFGLEIDHSVSGNLFAPGTSTAVAGYNRSTYAEGTQTGSVASGTVITTTYTSGNDDPALVGTPQEGSLPGRVISPDISFDDVYTAPLRVSGGLEYIFGKHNTVYANAGYTRAEGKKGGSAEINEELLRTVSTQNYNTQPANGPLGTPVGAAVEQTSFYPNETVATFDYEFNDLEKYDFEIGGRHYFNPIMKGAMKSSLTPFVSASGGAAHYSETTVRESQRQRYIQRVFDNTQVNSGGDFYDVSFGTPSQIYDAQWVPYGAMKAGVEWQMSPKQRSHLKQALNMKARAISQTARRATISFLSL